MSTLDHGFALLLLLVTMDLAVFGAVVFFMKNAKTSSRDGNIKQTADLLETLVSDSTKLAEQWREQVEQKQLLLRRMSEELDEKIVSLKLLCSRAETLARSSQQGMRSGPETGPLTGRETKIISLARKGRGTEEIAAQLALPRGEVDLVLGLEKKLSRLSTEKRLS